MNIGILTFHRAINYGAFLQAFALKNYLTRLGHNAYIVDYWPEGHANTYRLFDRQWQNRSFYRKMRYLIYAILRYRKARKRKEKMDTLLLRYLDIGSIIQYKSADSLSKLQLPCIIYGSDQIWWKSTLYNYEGFDPVYWGEFISQKIRKVAYAPSMGTINLKLSDRIEIKKYLSNFDYISVRESGLKEAIASLTSKEISVVLDPVFLLSKKDWNQLCVPIRKSRYILYYNLLPSKDADKLVGRLQKKFKCRIVEITGSVNPLKFGKRFVQTADAIEFISLIKEADFVVTTSFHGTAFSILFEKQFFALGMGENSGRAYSLLSMLNLEERLLNNPSEVIDKIIDYEIVSPKLDKLVKSSIIYLANSLQ